MATHSSILAWRIPGTGEPGGLLSMGWHRVGHDLSDLAAAVVGWKIISFAYCIIITKEKDLSPLYAAAAKSLQLCPALCDPIDSRDSPGKNTGVGCHFLLQCMKMKSESEVAQSCPTLSDLMDFRLPGSSIHGIFQARVLE